MAKLPGLLLISATLFSAGALAWVAHVHPPHMGRQSDGSYLVPTNQRLTPAGRVQTMTGYVSDAAMSGDGRRLAVLGTSGLTIYNCETRDYANDYMKEFYPDGYPMASIPGINNFMGLAWAPDGSTVYVANQGQIKVVGTGNTGAAISRSQWKVLSTIDAETASADSAHPGAVPVGGLACSPDGKLLFAAVPIRNAIHVFSLPDGKLIRKVPVGICPNHLAVSGDGTKLYVTNRGGERRDVPDSDLCDSAGTPVPMAPGRDTAAAGSVSQIDLQTYDVRSFQVGHQPAGLALSHDGATLYVGCSDDDTVEVLNTTTGAVEGSVSLRPPADAGFGQIPSSLALSRDGSRLFVACGGANAIAVLTTGKTPKVMGYIPTGWYPNAVVAGSRTLAVTCRKGLGSILQGLKPGMGPHDIVGTVQAIPLSVLDHLPEQTQIVAKNNQWGADLPARPNVAPVPIPARVGEPSLIKHVIYIIKENMTYDDVLGDRKDAAGEPSLCLFPRSVTPNTHALTEQFVTLTNASASSQCSGEGHQWAIAGVANGYIEMTDWSRSYPKRGDDVLAHSPAGSVWNPVVQKGLPVKCYGWYADKTTLTDRKTGLTKNFDKWDAKALWDLYQNRPSDMVVETHTTTRSLDPCVARDYPEYGGIFPEVWKADIFLKDFRQWERDGKMPSLTLLQFGNDHTAGTSPKYPTPRAMVADNDAALGKVVDAVSHSRFWKDTLIVSVEDDSQTGLDHIDGHRTVMLCVSPYCKRGAIIDEPYNQTSLIRTIGLVLGTKPLNRFDRTANALWACMSPHLDLRPYRAAESSVALTEWNPDLSALHGEDRQLALQCERMNWNVPDLQNSDIVTRAVWRSVKGNEPMSRLAFRAQGDDHD